MTRRHFLFLQGPHGPFFSNLAQALKKAGCRVQKIGFNSGDRFFWRDGSDYLAFAGHQSDWRAFLADLLDGDGITDIVVYGDTRLIHTVAREEANMRGISVHCFEEGYLRPYWVTYERDGANGHSPLMQMSVSQMQQAVGGHYLELHEAPPQWGALWQHIILGAIYHANILLRNGKYRNYEPHRTISVGRELGLYLRRLLLYPWHGYQRRVRTWKLKRSGVSYHLVLLQLAHDASFKSHSDFNSVAEFIELCCREFAAGAPKYHHLVFKSHPLEDNREPLSKLIRDAARHHGLEGRVSLVRGGKLGPLLDLAKSVVTVNSTAGQQALWRGLPLKTFGRSVYSKPEFVSRLPLAEFFAAPDFPDALAYRDYRQFLLETSQIPGGYYTRMGRAQILRNVTDMILANADPYEARYRRVAAQPRHLSLVSTGDGG